MTAQLGPITVTPRRPHDPFHASGKLLGFVLEDFWKWSVSDLVSNATRGIVAEFIVAKALGISTAGVRNEWSPYDLTTQNGLKVEVKSAAYLQSWNQEQLSPIHFTVRKTTPWNSETKKVSEEPKRQADVYVFAILSHKDKSTIDPLDVTQWAFYVLSTSVLDARTPSQHSITLNTLEKLAKGPMDYFHLREAVG
jgi:hypothetical protein